MVAVCWFSQLCNFDSVKRAKFGNFVVVGNTWKQHMMTSLNGNIFRVTGPLCGEFTGPGEFPTQRPVTRSFDVFFDLRLNKRLSKQPWGWWLQTQSWSLWRHCNELQIYNAVITLAHSKFIRFWWQSVDFHNLVQFLGFGTNFKCYWKWLEEIGTTMARWHVMKFGLCGQL